MAKHPGDCLMEMHGKECRRCWHAEHSPRFQQLWGLPIATGIAEIAPQSRRVHGISGGQQQREGVNLVKCGSCKGNVRLKVPAVNNEHFLVSQMPPAPNPALMSAAQATPHPVKALTWAYGVTTVPERRTNGLLLRSLASLSAAGFDKPRLFIDGDPEGFSNLGLPFSYRSPKVRTVGNWLLTAMELLIREPQAERYAIFQDDLIASKNLRQYLEAAPYPDRGYCNLFTFRLSEASIHGKAPGWHRAAPLNSSAYPEDWQKGLGAVALVFSREALTTLLQSPHIARKIMDVGADTHGKRPEQPARLWPSGEPRQGGQVRIDGTIVTAMNMAGWHEYVHAPSLVQHLGLQSAMGNHGQEQAQSFRGEEFDCLALLPPK